MTSSDMFNPGELHFQKLSGVEKKVSALAPHLILNEVPEQHQVFYSNLNMVFVGTVDETGQPWASVLCGKKGFVNAINEKKIQINAQPIKNDPLVNNTKNGSQIGLLGLEFETRRRNRVNGQVVTYNDENIVFEVNKAFGNCPKYIQTRDIKEFVVNSENTKKNNVEVFDSLNDDINQWITYANTFFIASYYSQEDHRGVDVSHRGGKQGFIKVTGNKTMSFDDYPGNNVYMTLGNMQSNPVVGLLFIDFDTGDVMQLACCSEIIETPEEEHARKVILKLKSGRIMRQALIINSDFLEYSRFV